MGRPPGATNTRKYQKAMAKYMHQKPIYMKSITHLFFNKDDAESIKA